MNSKMIYYGLILLLLSGCSFVDLHNDLQEQKQLTLISGEITATPETSQPIAVVLVKGSNQNLEVVQHIALKQPGRYSFLTPPDTYRIFTFEDSNRDSKYTALERIQRTSFISATTAGSHHVIDIKIPPRPSAKLLAEIKQIQQAGIITTHNTLVEVGTTIPLDDPNFSRENAGKGLWQPYQSVKEIKFGLFFLEKYDPNKKIVLFIHGVSGTPNQFKPIIAELDHDQFQPLVAFYPSGFPLPLISRYLSRMVDELYATHSIQPISIVAHSMGGLVSRGVINIQNSHKKPLVDSFISISTPWDGHATAGSGLKYAPVVIPVWRDMVPGSDFLKTLEAPLKDTPHYLLFGFRGSSRVAGKNSDGVVSIASQLKPTTQSKASLVRGFDEDHVSILTNEEVIGLVQTLLKENL